MSSVFVNGLGKGVIGDVKWNGGENNESRISSSLELVWTE
jgi:hypothetical protein